MCRTGFWYARKKYASRVAVIVDNNSSDVGCGARSNIKQLLSIFRPAPTPEQDLSPSITTSNDPSFSRWTWKQVYCTNALRLRHTHTHTHTRWGPLLFWGEPRRRRGKKVHRKQEIDGKRRCETVEGPDWCRGVRPSRFAFYRLALVGKNFVATALERQRLLDLIAWLVIYVLKNISCFVVFKSGQQNKELAPIISKNKHMSALENELLYPVLRPFSSGDVARVEFVWCEGARARQKMG